MVDYKIIELIKEALRIDGNQLLCSNELGYELKELFQKERKRIEEMNKIEQQIYNTGAIPKEFLFLKEGCSVNLTHIEKYLVEL